MSFQNIAVVSSCPPELMGEPSPPIPPTELQKLPSTEIHFTPFSEDWNEYKLPVCFRNKIAEHNIKQIIDAGEKESEVKTGLTLCDV